MEKTPTHEKLFFPDINEACQEALKWLGVNYRITAAEISIEKSRDRVVLNSSRFTPDLYMELTNHLSQDFAEIPCGFNVNNNEIVIGLNGPMSYFPPISAIN